jgi:hypothetical protein
MEKSYSTARFVFGLISFLGWVVITLAPLWVIIAGAASAALGGAGAFGGMIVAIVQAIFGLCIIAGGQLGLAQLAVANNTAQILGLIQAQINAGTPATPQPAPTARKEPWVRKPQE